MATAMSWISLFANRRSRSVLPRVQHLAAQRQDRLRFLVAAHLRAAAGRVALDQEELVERRIASFAIGELARQHGDARALALLDLLARALARLRLADDELGELLAVLDMLVQPQLERRPRMNARTRRTRVADCSAAP